MVGGKMINLSSYQSAIYKKLTSLGYNVYDEVPENAKFPYVVIGDMEFQESQWHFEDILDASVNLLIWSIWEGKKEVNDISSNIINNFINLEDIKTGSQSLYRFSFGNSVVKRLDGVYNGSLALEFSVKQI